VSRRTTLRPIDATPSNAPLEASPPPNTTTPRPTVSRTTLVAAALLSIGILIAGALALGGSKSSPATQGTPATVAAPIATVPAPVATLAVPGAATVSDACPSVASFVDVVTSYERQGRWSLAASTTQTALRTPGLCPSDRTTLGQNLVSLSREALFEQPPAPEDAPGQRRVATAYTDLKSLAGQYGVQSPAPLPIAQSAYDNRLFLLATVAYADAFANGDSSTEDRDVVRADYAAQYNLGHVWAQRTDSTQHQEGLARLATACRIDERNQLNSQEACTELQSLVGPRNKWPAPLADPLINR
jgi:hypothetical protein